MENVMNSFLNIEYSNFFCNNFIETLIWFVIIYLYTIIWEFLKLVAYYSSIDEHNLENSIFFPELLTLSTNIIRPKTIKIVDSLHLVDDAVDQLQRKIIIDFPVLGMDCEMKSRIGKTPVIHLLQLATKDGYCVLFRITFLPYIPLSLSNLLSNDDIWKVGIGVYNDILYLLNQYPNQFTIGGTFDLRYLAHYFGIPERGLKALASKLLQAHYNYYSSRGEWDDIELTPDRIMYAAIDAYLGILLFQKFFEMYSEKVFGENVSTNNVAEKDKLKSFMQKWVHKTSQKFRNNY